MKNAYRRAFQVDRLDDTVESVRKMDQRADPRGQSTPSETRTRTVTPPEDAVSFIRRAPPSQPSRTGKLPADKPMPKPAVPAQSAPPMPPAVKTPPPPHNRPPQRQNPFGDPSDVHRRLRPIHNRQRIGRPLLYLRQRKSRQQYRTRPLRPSNRQERPSPAQTSKNGVYPGAPATAVTRRAAWFSP